MKIRTDELEIEIVNEPAYNFGSADNARSYPFTWNRDPTESTMPAYGVLLDGEPLAVFGDWECVAKAHEHSALLLNGLLYIAVAGRIFCLQPKPFELRWVLRADSGACFGVHYHQPSGALIAHGELEITRFNESGDILWQSSGRDIFTGELKLEELSVLAVDFNGDVHRFRYSDGQDEEEPFRRADNPRHTSDVSGRRSHRTLAPMWKRIVAALTGRKP